MKLLLTGGAVALALGAALAAPMLAQDASPDERVIPVRQGEAHGERHGAFGWLFGQDDDDHGGRDHDHNRDHAGRGGDHEHRACGDDDDDERGARGSGSCEQRGMQNGGPPPDNGLFGKGMTPKAQVN
ncbi:hypothetical protein [Frigidibacter sp. ROC022]|uniref:hypothetical protein n=1 Tax=Frigidibacter sp. ROC022 TaxID=2971796 RepID=UPI00215B252D|nr:hypothetical protein [Frigidibacter sp. ROC022]MCR8725377.1 hypothetical protein [Frigidibacter sp. ROC022]